MKRGQKGKVRHFYLWTSVLILVKIAVIWPNSYSIKKKKNNNNKIMDPSILGTGGESQLCHLLVCNPISMSK